MKKSEFKDCAIYAERIARLRPFPKGTLKSLRDYYRVGLAQMRAGWTLAIILPICRAEYIATLEKAGRAPADFVRFIRDRVCETQKELLLLMGESIQLDEGIKANFDEGLNEGINQLLSVIASRPGARANELATLIGKSRQTVERYVKTLKDRGRIEFRGSKKTGGYFAKD